MLTYPLTNTGPEELGLMRIARLQREINAGHELDEILKTLVTNTLKSQMPTYAFIAESHSEGFFSLLAQYGADGNVADHLADINPGSEHPISLAIQTAHLVCIASDSTTQSHENTTAYQPIVFKGISAHVLVVGFSERVSDDQSLTILLDVVSHMIANRLNGHTKLHSVVDMKRVVEMAGGSTLSDINLSKRQLKIAEMIADGMTNRQISRQLGFTEATIRYETIKLYERLRVKNRAQASSRIRELLSR